MWKDLLQELGDLCHESYLGHNSTAPNEYEYCYKNEVINLLDTPEGKAIFNKYFTKIIEDKPPKPEHWDNWSIERQLGYKFALEDAHQQLRDKWLSPKE